MTPTPAARTASGPGDAPSGSPAAGSARRPAPAHFLQPVEAVRALDDASPPSSPEPGATPEHPPGRQRGGGHAGAEQHRPDAAGQPASLVGTMGVGEGDAEPARTLQHHRHHRHHSDTTVASMAKQGDAVMLDRRPHHADSSYKVKVQDKTSRSAPQKGRCITVTACSQTTRPQRWSLGCPAEAFTTASSTSSTWDIVLGRPASPSRTAPRMTANGMHGTSRVAPLNGVPTVSLATERKQSRQQGHLRSCSSGSYPEGTRADGDLANHRVGDDTVLPDHVVRFVYPERSCPRCPHEGLDVGVQAAGPPPLQLYVLPQHRCGCGRGRGRTRRGGGAAGAGGGACLWLVQAVFCLAGLATIILVLALVGAAAFHTTEGPHEDLQVQQLNKLQADMVIQLATDLRVGAPEDSRWRGLIERSVEQHEQMLLRATAAGYGEGGAGEGGARIWTYPGGLLFAASLLTTLGFGAPVPRTPLGRLAAVVLAVVGIPLNVILALQLGRLLCSRLPRLLPVLNPAKQAAVSLSDPRQRHCLSCWPASGRRRDGAASRAARWAPMLLPVGALLAYYVLGMVVFGAVLALPASEWLVFPLSLTAAGGVARVPGWVRVSYAAYLEGGVLLAAVAVALLQAPATTATTDLAMSLGILDVDDDYDNA